jgi:hypothetical protein
VGSRGASTGQGTLTLDALYLSAGWLRNASENRINNINMVEVYHAILGNLEMPEQAVFIRGRVQAPPARTIFSGKLLTY